MDLNPDKQFITFLFLIGFLSQLDVDWFEVSGGMITDHRTPSVYFGTCTKGSGLPKLDGT